MLDWNGNGKIDPVDIGISIAAQTPDEFCEKNTECNDIPVIPAASKGCYIKKLRDEILRLARRIINVVCYVWLNRI